MTTRLILVIICLTSCAFASDWPTYRHDNQRSGTTDVSPKLPLTQAWQVTSPAPPQRAWAGPAKWDAFAALDNQRSMRDFDPAFYVTSADHRVYFGSSVDDSVHCLDLETGEQIWQFRTDGPVRIAPTLHNNKTYFGSDDGYVYCLDASKGNVVWKYRPIKNDKLIASNGKLISQWPCRTGVLVQDNTAFFSMSLLPWQPTYVCAVNCESAEELYKTEHKNLTAQAPMIASQTRLYLPQGRQRPIACDLANGNIVGGLGNAGQGGTFALLTPENELIHGVGQTHGSGGELRGFNTESGDQIATFPTATSMVIKNDKAWFCNFKELVALDRDNYMALQTRIAANNKQLKVLNDKLKKLTDKTSDEARPLNQHISNLRTENKSLTNKARKCFQWKKYVGTLNTLICAGDVLFAGAENKVIAYSTQNGDMLWQADVDGTVYGLAVARNTLLVSTDTGSIVCFKSQGN